MVVDFSAAVADSLFDPAAYEPYAGFLKRLLTPGPVPTVADLLRYPRLAEVLLPRSAFGPAGGGRADLGGPTGGAYEALTLVIVDRPLEGRAARDAVVEAARGVLADVPGATVTGLGVLGHDAEQATRAGLRASC